MRCVVSAAFGSGTTQSDRRDDVRNREDVLLLIEGTRLRVHDQIGANGDLFTIDIGLIELDCFGQNRASLDAKLDLLFATAEVRDRRATPA